jgi:hypothetical protein
MVEIYNYVYFIILKKYDHIYSAPLIKIAGSVTDELYGICVAPKLSSF